jgi:hypothetical protein
MKLAKEKQEYYSVERYGIPINDLDSIGTIVTFSATLIWVGFPRQGRCLSQGSNCHTQNALRVVCSLQICLSNNELI